MRSVTRWGFSWTGATPTVAEWTVHARHPIFRANGEPNRPPMRLESVTVADIHGGSTDGRIEITLDDDQATPVGLVGTDFETFCTREQASLTRALTMALDHRELGRDATAEALARAWERWDTVSAYDNPAGWVYRVGLNWGRSRLRKRRREVSAAFVPERSRPSTDHDDRVTDAIAGLSRDHRDVVIARYYLDWSEAQIADALDVPAGTVKSRLHRALQHLEAELGSQP